MQNRLKSKIDNKVKEKNITKKRENNKQHSENSKMKINKTLNSI